MKEGDAGKGDNGRMLKNGLVWTSRETPLPRERVSDGLGGGGWGGGHYYGVPCGM